MNIFYLDPDPRKCAEMHNDKHTVKMILEYAQLLSTAHRVLDGTLNSVISNSGRRKTVYTLNDARDGILYSATHINHPSAIWVRQSKANYDWLYDLWCRLIEEYAYRYGKDHACAKLDNQLQFSPDNIPKRPKFTEPTPAMPDDVKVSGDSIKSYRNYYIQNKQHLASWKGKVNSRNKPEWFDANV
jgi:hypothetical protein